MTAFGFVGGKCLGCTRETRLGRTREKTNQLCTQIMMMMVMMAMMVMLGDDDDDDDDDDGDGDDDYGDDDGE